MSLRLALTALLLAAAASTAAAEPLGRLFYTAQERQALVAARQRGEPVEALSPAGSGEAATPRLISLAGIVERGSRPPLAWINGTAVEDGASLHGLRVRIAPPGIRLQPPLGPAHTLAVGQTLDLDSGRILDRLPPGSLAVEPRR